MFHYNTYNKKNISKNNCGFIEKIISSEVLKLWIFIFISSEMLWICKKNFIFFMWSSGKKNFFFLSSGKKIFFPEHFKNFQNFKFWSSGVLEFCIIGKRVKKISNCQKKKFFKKTRFSWYLSFQIFCKKNCVFWYSVLK